VKIIAEATGEEFGAFVVLAEEAWRP